MFHLMKWYTETKYKLFVPEFHVGMLIKIFSTFKEVQATV